ncbi:hypothetical protein NKR23_g3904 [Pleurostoma richardsiae]|uniref:CENP-V/GFA domain-containing protein n=1 Tax=Pleurostoma richardsiae TaxID=41990 RepID=A0AA38RSX5_9PEZI|nr:hypothetical protein NKR23_g3904 [Pleurostoma richardsiae]
MVGASCFCGNIGMNFDGEPLAHIICHCLDCRKISGGHFTDLILLDESVFRVRTGTPRSFTKTNDSGKPITHYFCGDCGSMLYRKTPSMPGKLLFLSGMIDDPEWTQSHPPREEIFAQRKAAWMPQICRLPGSP